VTFKLRTKMTMGFVLIAVLLIIVTAMFGKIMLENHFTNYIIQRQENNNKDIVNLLTQQYISDNSWRTEVIENIGIRALEQGQIVKVTDLSGKTIWDAMVHNNGMCEQMLQHMASNMASKYPSFNGEYTISTYPATANFQKVGTIEIGYYGPYYFNDEDLNFINVLNKALLWVALFALIISLLLGHLFAKKISDPIGRVINTARMIEKGDYTVRSKENTTTKEIQELINTINNLSITLQEKDNLRKRLTADVAHELRTPLATLQSHMEAMIDGIWNPSVDRLKSCHEEIVRISKMVGHMQLLSKYENEVKKIEKKHFELSEMVTGILLNFESEFKEKRVKTTQSGNATVYADQDKLKQVMINLISNALKYTPEGGNVGVEMYEENNSAIIKVKDNGCGIKKEDLPYIFERFYRADQSRTRLTGGAGVGLSIVKAIVSAHGGAVQVESEMNLGTTFTVTLPNK